MSKLFAAIWFFFAIASLWYTTLANAVATDDSGFGTDFIVGVVPNPYCSSCNLMLFINTKVPNNATISSYITGDIEISEFQDVATVVLPPTLITGNNPDWQDPRVPYYAVRVRTQELASVQAMVNSTQEIGRNEGIIVFPVKALGTKYLVNSVTASPSFLVVASVDSTIVSIHLRDGTVMDFNLYKALQTIHTEGMNLDGAMIQASSPVAVFIGAKHNDGVDDWCDCTDPWYNHEAYNTLWEQAVPVEKFGHNFVLVNPGAEQQIYPFTTLRLVNGDSKPVFVDISGLTNPYPIKLIPGQAVAIQTGNLTNKISSTGLIDIQVISGSPSVRNLTQWGLIPNDQFVNQALFFVESSTTNLLSLVGLTSDITNSHSSLKFNGVQLDLKLFQPSADPDYSYVIITPQTGPNFMDSSFKLAGYLFEHLWSDSKFVRFGSAIGRNL